MPAEWTNQIIITEEDIWYAEKCLFGRTGVFDDERKDFIKNFTDSLDVQAVPGSGKTTALMAKMLILEKISHRLKSSVLVISHTNTAINSIKRKIWIRCNNIMWEYPHFVGTIQWFVDRFLAIPYFSQLYNSNVKIIDDDTRFSEFKKRFIRWPIGIKAQLTWLWVELAKKTLTFPQFNALANKKIDERRDFIASLRVKKWDPLIHTTADKQSFLKSPKSQTYITLHSTLNDLLEKGILRFNDAFDLAFDYLEQYPFIKKALQLRFKYVFVDEMQDMNEKQYAILEEIFYDNWNASSVYQRVGDMNQSIFHDHGDEIEKTKWTPRNLYPISWSNRLHSLIAKVVSPFASIVWIQISGQLKTALIRPYILLYDDADRTRVFEAFANLIVSHKVPEKVEEKPIYKAIAWTTKNKTTEWKLCMNSYFPAFRKELSKSNMKTKVYHPSLLSYLVCWDWNDKTFYYLRQNILNGIISAIKTATGRRTIDKLMDELETFMDRDQFKDFLLKLFQWCKYIRLSNGALGRMQVIRNKIKDYILDNIVPYYDVDVQEAREFLSSNETIANYHEVENKTELENNIVSIDDNIKIQLDSIHWVKWETHDATLYLETFFYKNDSSYLFDQLLGTEFKSGGEPNQAKATKMAYVWFSRAKFLLCYAIRKTSLSDKQIAEIKEQGLWQVKNLEDIL